MSLDAQNPYVGLRPFNIDESLIFFGRQDQTLELLQRLHQHHFVAVVGASGCGKSSLLRAGLIPSLKAGYLVDDSDKWFIAIMKPGQSPIYNLIESIVISVKPEMEASEINKLVKATREEGSDVILKFIVSNCDKKKTNFFLLIDQFEELFHFVKEQNDINKKNEEFDLVNMDEAVEFVNILLELSLSKNTACFVVITMRSDFIGECSQFYGLPEAMNKSQYLVPRLNRVQLKTAIEGPSKLYGGKMNPVLISQILNDLGEVKDELPLLQHALMRIWNHEIKLNKNGELGLEGYQSIGGIKNALNKHAEEALLEMTDEDLVLSRKIFQALTTIDNRGRKVRRPTFLSELVKLTNAEKSKVVSLINHFNSDNRSFLILSKSGGSDDLLIDISHESLIENWKLLKEWVEEESKSVGILLRIEEACRLYNTKQKDLLFGTELAVASDWYQKQKPDSIWWSRYGKNFNESIKYLEKSKLHFEFEIAEKDKAAKQLAEDEIKKHIKERKRQMSIIITTSFAAIIFLILAMSVLRQKRSLNHTYVQLDSSNKYTLRSLKLSDSLKEVANYQTVKALNQQHKADSLFLLAIHEKDEANYQKKQVIDLQIKIDTERNSYERRSEYERTEVRIRELRGLPENKRDQSAENTFNFITGYLWIKGDSASLNKLVKLLRENEDLIPTNYGQNRVELIRPVEDDYWPISLEYNPKIEFDYSKLNNGWARMVKSFATDWGIPVASPLRTSYNNNIPSNQVTLWGPKTLNSRKLTESNQKSPQSNSSVNNTAIIVKSDISFQKSDKEKVKSDKTDNEKVDSIQIEVSWPKNYYLINRDDIFGNRLDSLFRAYEKEFILAKNLSPDSSWYFVPRWILPIFYKNVSHSYSNEEAVACIVANTLLEKPSIVLTEDAIKLLLMNQYKEKPFTIKEAILNRGGLEGIRKDLIEIVLQKSSLNNFLYLLDALSNYWKEDSKIADSCAIYDQTDITAIDRLIQGGRKIVPLNLDSLLGNLKWDYYNDSRQLLSLPQPPVRIYLGKQIENKCTIGGDLSPKLLEELFRLRVEIYSKYGISSAVVRFREQKNSMKENQISIEMFNQSDLDTNEHPITLYSKDIIPEMIKELKTRYIGCRIFWIDADYVNKELQGFKNKDLKEWLLNNYTLTDIKLILRSIISPEEKEIDFYKNYKDNEAIASIPPYHTLYNLEWLLGSLVFWTKDETINLKSSKAIGEILRETQRARIIPNQEIQNNKEIELALKNGINALLKGNINEAEKYFSSALAKNSNAARTIFLKIYPDYSYLTYSKSYKSFLDLDAGYYPRPGKTNDTWHLTPNELYELENAISSEYKQFNQDDIIKLQLVLLFNYLDHEYYDRAERTYSQLLNKYLAALNTDQKYLMGYFGLQINKADPNNPKYLKETISFLQAALTSWHIEKLSGPYLELLDIVSKQFKNYRWSWDLTIQLTKIQSESFWMNYYLATFLQLFKDQFEYSEIALNHINKAETLIGQLDDKSRNRIKYWISFERGLIYYNLAQYQMGKNSNQYCQLGIKEFEDLLEHLPLEENNNVPNKFEVISNLSYLYEINGEIDKGYKILNESLVKFPDNESLLDRKFSALIRNDEVDNALELAKNLHSNNLDNSGYLYLLTLAEILAGSPDAEYHANEFLVTDHEYKDYIRMLLYYYLSLKGKKEQGKEMLMRRWEKIDTSTWNTRSDNGDINVWREMLIAYYLGKISENDFIVPLKDSTLFINHPFSKMSSLTGMRCEGYFYIGLKKGADGDSRSFERYMMEAIETKHFSYYEYLMANHFLNQIRK